MEYSFEELYQRFANINKKEMYARVEGDYRKQILGYVKGYLAKVVVNPEIAEQQFITPEDIALVLDVYGINAEGQRLSHGNLAEKYNMTKSRASARFAAVVKLIKAEQTKNQDLGLSN